MRVYRLQACKIPGVLDLWRNWRPKSHLPCKCIAAPARVRQETIVIGKGQHNPAQSIGRNVLECNLTASSSFLRLAVQSSGP